MMSARCVYNNRVEAEGGMGLSYLVDREEVRKGAWSVGGESAVGTAPSPLLLTWSGTLHTASEWHRKIMNMHEKL